MSEWNQVLMGVLKLFGVLCFSGLYSAGGRKFKWLRRFLAPSVLLAFCFFTASEWEWYYFLPFIGLSLALTYGYGAEDPDDDFDKLIKRGVFGVLLGLQGIILGFMTGNTTLGFIQLIMAVFASLALGVLNPLKAPYEELLIGGISVILIPFMA